jgi:hypothetical protein
MKQSLWEGNSPPASQEIPSVVWKRKVHSLMCWQESVTFHPISLRFNVILSSHLRLGLPNWLVLSSFATMSFLYIFHLFHACYMSRSPHRPLFDHFNICWSVQVMKFLIMQYSPTSRYFLLGPNIFLRTLFSDTIYVLPLVWETKFNTHTKQQIKL